MIKDDMPLSKPCAKVRERERGGGGKGGIEVWETIYY